MSRRCYVANTAGFTLLETLIALVLVGTAVGLGMEGARVYREIRASRAAAAKLVTVLSRARDLAVATGRPVAVDFAPGETGAPSRSFHIQAEAGRSDGLDAEEPSGRLPDATRISPADAYTLPADVRFGGPSEPGAGPLGEPAAPDGVSFRDDRVRFLPDGTASEAGLLTVSGELGQTHGVVVTADGVARMFRHVGGTWRPGS